MKPTVPAWGTVPPEAEASFKALRGDVMWLHFEWDNFKRLYVGTASIRLLNRTAGGFFAQVEWNALDAIILGVTRLLDPAMTGNWRNLSLASLIELLDVPAHRRHVASLKKRLARLKALEGPFRTQRDKRVSHTDADFRLVPAKYPLPKLPRRRIEAMLRGLAEFLIAIERRLDRTTTIYPPESGPYTDSGALIWILRKADAQGYLRPMIPVDE